MEKFFHELQYKMHNVETIKHQHILMKRIRVEIDHNTKNPDFLTDDLSSQFYSPAFIHLQLIQVPPSVKPSFQRALHL